MGGTSIIYGVTDMVFSLKQHIPPSGELIFAEVSLVLHRSHGQSKYAVPFRLGAECVAHPLVWSHGASVRQLSFYGPVSLYLGILSLFGFQGATEAV